MDKLIKDSRIIQDLFENNNENFQMNYEDIIKQFPTVDFNLLLEYYNGYPIGDNIDILKLAGDINLLMAYYNRRKDIDLLKLAEDMSYLDCGELVDVLIKIKNSSLILNENSLNKDLMREIKELDKIIKIACGAFHSVALKKDGTFIVWGNDSYDQRNMPPLMKNGGYIDIACGNDHSALLHKNGTVTIFGKNNYNFERHTSPDKKYVKIVCGPNSVIMFNDVGEIKFWGHERGPIDNGYIDIVSGDYHSIALKNDGTIKMFTKTLTESVITDDCYVKIAVSLTYSVALNKESYIKTWGGSDHGQQNDKPTSNGFIDIACGYNHSVALHKDGHVTTWGNKSMGERDNSPSPTEIGFIAIACGNFHSVALHEDGRVVTWGNTKLGQILDFPHSDKKYIAIACGNNHSLALREDGTIVQRGEYGMNQLKDFPY